MKFILAVLLSSLISFSVFAATPKHYVFLIHGISADQGTFGKMNSALTREAQGFDPGTNWKFINFNYQTGSYHKSVMIFARELSDFIADHFRASGGINTDDKFSLIMHSQGGLIGLNFLIRAQSNDPLYHPELKNHLDAFITMGTPYWGAKIASFATKMFPIFKKLGIPWPDRFGKEELEDMELVSDFGASMRLTMIAAENQTAINEIMNQGRFLIISGVTKKMKFLSKRRAWYEGDMVVPTASSQLDFLYFIDKKIPAINVVGENEFKETKLIDNNSYLAVKALHVSPLNQNHNFPAIAFLPDDCLRISYKDCEHPAYKYVVEHLFKLDRSSYNKPELTSFAIDLKINSAGLKIDRKKISITYKPLSAGLRIGSDVELYQKVSRWSVAGNYRLYQTGYIDLLESKPTTGKVQMNVAVDGYKERVLIVPVKTAKSTYIELNLTQ